MVAEHFRVGNRYHSDRLNTRGFDGDPAPIFAGKVERTRLRAVALNCGEVVFER